MKLPELNRVIKGLEQWAWDNHHKYRADVPYFRYSAGIIGRSLPLSYLDRPLGRKILKKASL